MAKAPAKGAAKESSPGKRALYKVEGDKLVRLRKTCPKCGAGTFLAEHEDRTACGRCGYTEFKAKA